MSSRRLRSQFKNSSDTKDDADIAQKSGKRCSPECSDITPSKKKKITPQKESKSQIKRRNIKQKKTVKDYIVKSDEQGNTLSHILSISEDEMEETQSNVLSDMESQSHKPGKKLSKHISRDTKQEVKDNSESTDENKSNFQVYSNKETSCESHKVSNEKTPDITVSPEKNIENLIQVENVTNSGEVTNLTAAASNQDGMNTDVLPTKEITEAKKTFCDNILKSANECMVKREIASERETTESKESVPKTTSNFQNVRSIPCQEKIVMSINKVEEVPDSHVAQPQDTMSTGQIQSKIESLEFKDSVSENMNSEKIRTLPCHEEMVIVKNKVEELPVSNVQSQDDLNSDQTQIQLGSASLNIIKSEKNKCCQEEKVTEIIQDEELLVSHDTQAKVYMHSDHPEIENTKSRECSFDNTTKSEDLRFCQDKIESLTNQTKELVDSNIAQNQEGKSSEQLHSGIESTNFTEGPYDVTPKSLTKDTLRSENNLSNNEDMVKETIRTKMDFVGSGNVNDGQENMEVGEDTEVVNAVSNQDGVSTDTPPIKNKTEALEAFCDSAFKTANDSLVGSEMAKTETKEQNTFGEAISQLCSSSEQIVPMTEETDLDVSVYNNTILSEIKYDFEEVKEVAKTNLAEFPVSHISQSQDSGSSGQVQSEIEFIESKESVCENIITFENIKSSSCEEGKMMGKNNFEEFCVSHGAQAKGYTSTGKIQSEIEPAVSKDPVSENTINSEIIRSPLHQEEMLIIEKVEELPVSNGGKSQDNLSLNQMLPQLESAAANVIESANMKCCQEKMLTVMNKDEELLVSHGNQTKVDLNLDHPEIENTESKETICKKTNKSEVKCSLEEVESITNQTYEMAVSNNAQNHEGSSAEQLHSGIENPKFTGALSDVTNETQLNDSLESENNLSNNEDMIKKTLRPVEDIVARGNVNDRQEDMEVDEEIPIVNAVSNQDGVSTSTSSAKNKAETAETLCDNALKTGNEGLVGWEMAKTDTKELEMFGEALTQISLSSEQIVPMTEQTEHNVSVSDNTIQSENNCDFQKVMDIAKTKLEELSHAAEVQDTMSTGQIKPEEGTKKSKESVSENTINSEIVTSLPCQEEMVIVQNKVEELPVAYGEQAQEDLSPDQIQLQLESTSVNIIESEKNKCCQEEMLTIISQDQHSPVSSGTQAKVSMNIDHSETENIKSKEYICEKTNKSEDIKCSLEEVESLTIETKAIPILNIAKDKDGKSSEQIHSGLDNSKLSDAVSDVTNKTELKDSLSSENNLSNNEVIKETINEEISLMGDSNNIQEDMELDEQSDNEDITMQCNDENAIKSTESLRREDTLWLSVPAMKDPVWRHRLPPPPGCESPPPLYRAQPSSPEPPPYFSVFPIASPKGKKTEETKPVAPPYLVNSYLDAAKILKSISTNTSGIFEVEFEINHLPKFTVDYLIKKGVREKGIESISGATVITRGQYIPPIFARKLSTEKSDLKGFSTQSFENNKERNDKGEIVMEGSKKEEQEVIKPKENVSKSSSNEMKGGTACTRGQLDAPITALPAGCPAGRRPLHLYVKGPSRESLETALTCVKKLIAEGEEDEEMNVDQVFLSLCTHAPADFNLCGRVLGEDGANLHYIMEQTEAEVTLRGQKSGYKEVSGLEHPEMLHLRIRHKTLDGVIQAKEIAFHLMRTVIVEFKEFSNLGQQTSSAETLSGVQMPSGLHPVPAVSGPTIFAGSGLVPQVPLTAALAPLITVGLVGQQAGPIQSKNVMSKTISQASTGTLSSANISQYYPPKVSAVSSQASHLFPVTGNSLAFYDTVGQQAASSPSIPETKVVYEAPAQLKNKASSKSGLSSLSNNSQPYYQTQVSSSSTSQASHSFQFLKPAIPAPRSRPRPLLEVRSANTAIPPPLNNPPSATPPHLRTSSTLASTEVRNALASPEVRKALDSPDVRKALASPEMRNALTFRPQHKTDNIETKVLKSPKNVSPKLTTTKTNKKPKKIQFSIITATKQTKVGLLFGNPLVQKKISSSEDQNEEEETQKDKSEDRKESSSSLTKKVKKPSRWGQAPEEVPKSNKAKQLLKMLNEQIKDMKCEGDKFRLNKILKLLESVSTIPRSCDANEKERTQLKGIVALLQKTLKFLPSNQISKTLWEMLTTLKTDYNIVLEERSSELQNVKFTSNDNTESSVDKSRVTNKADEQEPQERRLKREPERRETERCDQDKREPDRRETERRDQDKREAERRETQRRDQEKREAERRETQRRDQEKREAERRETQRRDQEKREAERREIERRDRDKRESERGEREKRDQDRKERERRDQEKQEKERRERDHSKLLSRRNYEGQTSKFHSLESKNRNESTRNFLNKVGDKTRERMKDFKGDSLQDETLLEPQRKKITETIQSGSSNQKTSSEVNAIFLQTIKPEVFTPKPSREKTETTQSSSSYQKSSSKIHQNSQQIFKTEITSPKPSKSPANAELFKIVELLRGALKSATNSIEDNNVKLELATIAQLLEHALPVGVEISGEQKSQFLIVLDVLEQALKRNMFALGQKSAMLTNIIILIKNHLNKNLVSVNTQDYSQSPSGYKNPANLAQMSSETKSTPAMKVESERKDQHPEVFVRITQLLQKAMKTFADTLEGGTIKTQLTIISRSLEEAALKSGNTEKEKTSLLTIIELLEKLLTTNQPSSRPKDQLLSVMEKLKHVLKSKVHKSASRVQQSTAQSLYPVKTVDTLTDQQQSQLLQMIQLLQKALHSYCFSMDPGYLKSQLSQISEMLDRELKEHMIPMSPEQLKRQISPLVQLLHQLLQNQPSSDTASKQLKQILQLIENSLNTPTLVNPINSQPTNVLDNVQRQQTLTLQQQMQSGFQMGTGLPQTAPLASSPFESIIQLQLMQMMQQMQATMSSQSQRQTNPISDQLNQFSQQLQNMQRQFAQVSQLNQHQIFPQVTQLNQQQQCPEVSQVNQQQPFRIPATPAVIPQQHSLLQQFTAAGSQSLMRPTVNQPHGNISDLMLQLQQASQQFKGSE